MQLRRLADSDSSNLYLSNIPRSWNENNLVQFLAPADVKSVRLLRESDETARRMHIPSTGHSRGIGFARMASREEAEKVIDRISRMDILDDSKSPLKIRFADSEAQKSFKTRRQIPSPLQQSSQSTSHSESPRSTFSSDATTTPMTSRSDSFTRPPPIYGPTSIPIPPPTRIFDSPLPLPHVLQPLYTPSTIPLRASSAFALHLPPPQIPLLPPLAPPLIQSPIAPAVAPAYHPLPPLRPTPKMDERFEPHRKVDFPIVRPRNSLVHSRSVGAVQGEDLLGLGLGGKDERRFTSM